jgi:GT2 family glycosyltransferase
MEDSYPHILYSYDASIIVPTIDNPEQASGCIEELFNTTSHLNREVIVVDDGSQDKNSYMSVAATVYKHQQNVYGLHSILLNQQNLGFSASVNHGTRYAEGKYIVLCNDDVKVLPNWLDHMISAAESDPKIAIVGAKLLYPDDTIQHAGMSKMSNSLQFPHMNKLEPRDSIEASTSKYVWAVTGALFLIKRIAIQELGGLSTGYATAWEDVDYCLHAWTKGWKVYYAADAEAYHMEGATRGATYEQKRQKPLLWMERERAGESYFMKKWSGYRSINSLEALQQLNK